MFLKMNICVLVGLFFCVFIAIVLSGQPCWNICEWLPWKESSCTITCGGGTVYRTRKLCCPLNLSYSDCVKYCSKNYSDYSDYVTCNEMCYNGGSYYSGSCHCLPEYDGRCCLDKYDECVSSPCLNGGACRQGSDRFDCTCLPGYIGKRCEYDYNECSSNPCKNGGICTDRVNEYNCSCVPGYVGVHCEIEYDECVSSPCLNGGTCRQGSNRFDCTCLPGYVGTRCEYDYNECSSNPCENGGICTDRVDEYNCSCVPGYVGVHCEIEYDECVSSPCLNGGACRQGSNRFDCTCLPGYIGTSCEYDYNECSSNPCKNGGICTDMVDEYNCSCVPGYVGVNCVVVASTSSSHGLPVAGIAGGISAGVVIILVVVIGIILWRRYQHTKKNQHENDVTGEDEERTRRNEINDVSIKQDVIRGKEYEGLNFTKDEATQYLHLNDISLEENTDPKARSPDGESYEKLHPYVNSDIEKYSSLKIPKTDKDSETKYENTQIKQLD